MGPLPIGGSLFGLSYGKYVFVSSVSGVCKEWMGVWGSVE